MAEALTVFALSLLAAAAPTAVYVALLWWMDPYEKEPLPLLLSAFLWGAVPAVVLSVVLEFAVGIPEGRLSESLASLVDIGLTAPLVEEIVKGAALIVLLVAFRREFDDVLDGIVYGAMVGFGFAMTENVLYFVTAYGSGGFTEWSVVVVLRAAVFGLNHALFTSVFGAGLGLSRLERSMPRRLVLTATAFAAAVTLHSIHNVFAQLSSYICGAVVIGAVSDWLGVLAILLLAWATWRRERGWMAQELGEELALGTVTHPEYHAAQSAKRRLGLRWRAWSRSGWAAGAGVARLYQTITELAFKKSQARLTGLDQATEMEIRDLRRQIVELRERGFGAAAPAGGA